MESLSQNFQASGGIVEHETQKFNGRITVLQALQGSNFEMIGNLFFDFWKVFLWFGPYPVEKRWFWCLCTWHDRAWECGPNSCTAGSFFCLERRFVSLGLPRQHWGRELFSRCYCWGTLPTLNWLSVSDTEAECSLARFLFMLTRFINLSTRKPYLADTGHVHLAHNTWIFTEGKQNSFSVIDTCFLWQ